jgi:glutamate--cysteine ligase
MGFEQYANYALQVPLYVLIRKGEYISMAGKSFEDFMQGRLPGYEGHYPTMDDWALHLSTLFPEVRLKQYLEMRGADSGSLEHSLALAALWAGLLYEEETLEESFDFISDWTYEECVRLRAVVPRSGLNAPFRGVPLMDIARTVVHIAEQGLIRRGLKNEEDKDESLYLDYLKVILARNQSSAALLRSEFEGVYQGDMDAFMKGHID